MRILVTGGAGYIGRYVVRALRAEGCEALWLDLTAGEGDGIYADVGDRKQLAAAVSTARPDGIVHLAAHSSVAESAADPGKYAANILMCRNLAAVAGELPIVLASSAAVYGEGNMIGPIAEDELPAPANPYGWSKLASEAALPGAMILRLFNVAGGQGDEGDHLIPRAVQACAAGRPIRLNGDGRAWRDFVHVEDVARAFVASVLALSVGHRPRTVNICRGEGRCVYDVANEICMLSRPGTRVEWAPARPGDVRMLIGDNAAAREAIGWSPELRYEDIVASAIGPESYETLLVRARQAAA